jgi:hypothetical protein
LYKTPTYRLTGHIDAVDFKGKTCLEFKTTKDETIKECRLEEYTLQIGAYCKALELETGLKYKGIIFVINDSLHEYELTKQDIDNSWLTINERATEVYEKLFGEQN